jgi:hypothetical protein
MNNDMGKDEDSLAGLILGILAAAAGAAIAYKLLSSSGNNVRLEVTCRQCRNNFSATIPAGERNSQVICPYCNGLNIIRR